MSGLENMIDFGGPLARGIGLGQQSRQLDMARAQQEAAKEEAAAARELEQHRYDTARGDDLAMRTADAAGIMSLQNELGALTGPGLHVPGGQDASPLMPIYGSPEAASSLGGFGGEPEQVAMPQAPGGGLDFTRMSDSMRRAFMGDVQKRLSTERAENDSRTSAIRQGENLFKNLVKASGDSAWVERLKDETQTDDALRTSSFATNAPRFLPVIAAWRAAQGHATKSAIDAEIRAAEQRGQGIANRNAVDVLNQRSNGSDFGPPTPVTAEQEFAARMAENGTRLDSPAIRGSAGAGIYTPGEQNAQDRIDQRQPLIDAQVDAMLTKGKGKEPSQEEVAALVAQFPGRFKNDAEAYGYVMLRRNGLVNQLPSPSGPMTEKPLTTWEKSQAKMEEAAIVRLETLRDSQDGFGREEELDAKIKERMEKLAAIYGASIPKKPKPTLWYFGPKSGPTGGAAVPAPAQGGPAVDMDALRNIVSRMTKYKMAAGGTDERTARREALVEAARMGGMTTDELFAKMKGQ